MSEVIYLSKLSKLLNIPDTPIKIDDDIPKDAELGNYGGWQPFHNSIDWKTIQSNRDMSWLNDEWINKLKSIPHTKEWNKKVSDSKKIRTHCCLNCKKSFNPGNWKRHKCKSIQEHSSIPPKENKSMFW